jgi:hypothetical protein
VANRQNVILRLLFTIITLLLPHFLLLIIFFRPKIAKLPQYVDEIVFVGSRIPLSNQLVDSIEACIIEVVALLGHASAPRSFHGAYNPIDVHCVNQLGSD